MTKKRRPRRPTAQSAAPRITGGPEDRNENVRALANKLRRYTGFAISDLVWIRDHATELAHRAHCDGYGGAIKQSRPGASRGGSQMVIDGESVDVTQVEAHAFRGLEPSMLLETIREARHQAGEARTQARRVLPISSRVAREATDGRDRRSIPAECENCGRLVYPPAEYLSGGQCDTCRKYEERTGRRREPVKEAG